MKQSAFIGFHRRADNIKRWPLMSQNKDEMLGYHLYETSIIGHLLGAIAADVYNEDVSPERVAALALHHEGSELAGLSDIPSPVKYADPETRDMIKALEAKLEMRLLETLPDELQWRYESLLSQDKADIHAALAKSADILTAYIKCLYETKQGNYEFDDALLEMQLLVIKEREKFKAVDYFCDHFIERSVGTLDNLLKV